MPITRTIFILLAGLQVLSAGEIDGAILVTRSGGRSLDGVAKESEFNVGFRLGTDLAKFGEWQTRLAFARHRGDQDDPFITPSGPRQGLSQSDASFSLEASRRNGIDWGGGLEVRRDYLMLNDWPLFGLKEARTNYDRIWFKAFAANIPASIARFSPLVRAEIGFTPQHGRAAMDYGEAQMKALAPDFYLTIGFGMRFRVF